MVSSPNTDFPLSGLQGNLLSKFKKNKQTEQIQKCTFPSSGNSIKKKNPPSETAFKRTLEMML